MQQALSRLLVGKTVLVIATACARSWAPTTWWSRRGRVAEDGTPAELLAAGGLFARMASLKANPPIGSCRRRAHGHDRTHHPSRP
ncbi:MAG: hypothetical protein ACLUW6_04915 [Coriobacteriaceae bacterium]